MFFSKLPSIEYSVTRNKYKFTDEDFVITKNIFRIIEIKNEIYTTQFFKEYLIAEGARPDFVAEKVYKNASYDWVVLLTNQIKNLQNDWPLTNAMFEKLIYKKYDNPFETKHWVTKEVKNDLGEIVQPEGLVVYYDPADRTSYTLRYIKSYNPRVEEVEFGDTLLNSVTHYEYEQELNEKKRIIQILNPKYLNSFVSIFEALAGYLPSDQLSNESRNLMKTLNVSNIFSGKSLI